MQNLHYHSHFIRNNNSNCITWLDLYQVCHVQSWGCHEIIITQCSFHQKMFILYPSNMLFRLLFSTTDPGKWMDHIRLTYFELWDCWRHVQPVCMCNLIHFLLVVHVGCYIFHLYMKLTTYSLVLLNSVSYHLLLIFHISKWWLHKHLCKVSADPILVEQQMFHPMRHLVRHSNNTDTG